MSGISELIRAAQRAASPQAAARAWERAYRAAPANAEALLGYAEALLGAGRASAAIDLLEPRLDSVGDPARAHALLGEACVAVGRLEQAAAQFETAVRLQPDSAPLFNNLCVTYYALNRLQDAVRAGERAVALEPGYMEGRLNLGIAYQRMNNFAKACEQFQKAVEAAPDNPDLKGQLGLCLRAAGRLREANVVFQEYARLKPRDPIGHLHVGATYVDEKDWPHAEPSLRRVLELQPGHVGAQALLALTLMQMGQWEDAARRFRKLLTQNPTDRQAITALPFCYLNMGQLAEAEPLIARSLELYPKDTAARFNRSIALMNAGRLDDAVELAKIVARDDPTNADARQNLGMLLLARGDFAAGWPEYDWRLLASAQRPQPVPVWDGSVAPGLKLLVTHEQGAGDTILFARYLPLVRARVGRLTLICMESAAPLFAGLDCVDEVVTFREGDPRFGVRCNAQISMASLPRVFRTTEETIPAAIPYLHTDPQRVEAFRARMEREGAGLKVGLVWAGNPGFHGDRNRSPGLKALAPLAGVKGVRFYSFQKGAGRAQLSECPAGLDLIDLDADLHDYGDTAAALQNLDLLITSCTSVAHLAGALGVRTWVALNYAPYWLWMRDREDSPWYPSLRLFRQPVFGDWNSVFARVSAELSRFTSSR